MTDATPAKAEAVAPPDYYRQHSFKQKGAGRRETRDSLRAKGRFVKMDKGDAPMTQEAMQMFFQPRESTAATQERARKAAIAKQEAEKIAADRRGNPMTEGVGTPL